MDFQATTARLTQSSRESHEYHEHSLSRLTSLRGKLPGIEYEAIFIRHQIGSAIALLESELLNGEFGADRSRRLFVTLILLREAYLRQERIVQTLSGKSDPREKLERIARTLKGEVLAILRDASELTPIPRLTNVMDTASSDLVS